MASGAAGGYLRGMLEGCISGGDMGKTRRPYHKNCKCALHNSTSRQGANHRCCTYNNVSYPIRRTWSEGTLASPPTTGDQIIRRVRTHMVMLQQIPEGELVSPLVW